MKEEVKRYVEPALVKRARGAITRALASLEYRRGGDGVYLSVTQNGPSAVSGVVDNSTLFPDASDRIIPLKRNKQDSKDDAYLSNIITIEDWALPPDETDDRQAASGGSLDLLFLASRFARPEAERSMLTQLHALWPSGMRVRLNIVNRDARFVVEGDPAGSVPAAKMPEVAAADAIEVEGEFAAQDEPIDVAEADANPELDTSWPSPVVAPLDEFELETELQLASLAEGGDYVAACRDCTPCLAGRLEECENPLPPRSPDLLTNDIETWIDLAWRSPGVARPTVVVTDGEVAAGGWYEVVGCRVDDGEATVLVRTAWRQDEVEDRPGLHEGLIDGDAVQLEVGPELAGHRGVRYRTFHRSSGGRLVGRFALRAGTAAGALVERSAIEGLAVVRKTGDISTLTFVPNDRRLGLRLDLPRLSLAEAKEKYAEDSVVQMVVTGVHDGGGSAWLETADGTEGRVVKADIGSSGVGDVRSSLSECDQVQAVIREVKEHDGKVQLQVGLPYVSAPTVADARAKYPDGAPIDLRVTGINADGSRVWLITGDGFGAMATRKDAGSAGIADLRAALGKDDIVAGRVLSVREHNDKIQINVALPDLIGPSLVEATAQQFEPGTAAEFTVTGITADGKRAFLKSSSGAAATVTSGRVGKGVLSIAIVLTSGQTINGTVVRVGEHRGEPQIEVSMPEFVVPSISEQLAALRVAPNEVFDGVVDHATDFGVFVALGPVSGLVHKSKLPGFSPSAYPKGLPLRVAVLQAGEDPDRPGHAKIGLEPA